MIRRVFADNHAIICSIKKVVCEKAVCELQDLQKAHFFHKAIGELG
jgi:hypothetical protein